MKTSLEGGDQGLALKQISSALCLVLEHLDKGTFEYDTIELLASYAADQSNKIISHTKESQCEIL